MSRTEQEQVKANVKEAYGGKKEVGIDRDNRTFEVGDDVRVKLNKSKLSKGSDDNWSKTLYKIGKVITSATVQTGEESQSKRGHNLHEKRLTESGREHARENPKQTEEGNTGTGRENKEDSGIGARVRKARRRLFS